MTKQRTRHHSVRPMILILGAVAVVALAGTWAIAQCGAGAAKTGCGAAAAVDTAVSVTASPTPQAAKKCLACKDGKACEGCQAKCRKASRARLSAKVSGALKDLSSAEDAIKAGQTQTALAELAKVRKVLQALHARVKPVATVNSVCPMMGGKFNPNKIDAKLVVAHKDGNVGFCCAICIPKWNKLSDAAKDKKLAAALARKK